jgi:hypothetical protein
VWNIRPHNPLNIERTKIKFLMKVKILILSLLVVGAMASCKRQQCPAYGKTAPKTIVDKRHA